MAGVEVRTHAVVGVRPPSGSCTHQPAAGRLPTAATVRAGNPATVRRR